MSEYQTIIDNYLTGNNEAVADMYNQLKERLLLIAYSYCRDAELSRDIVQDILEKLICLPLDKRKEYFGTSGTSLVAYLTIFIRNKCFDHKKVKSNREKILSSIRNYINIESSNNAYNKFIEEALRSILNNLQPREAEIIRLHLEGYNNDEIAIKLNITYNTVKNNIYESKKKIREMWNIFM